MEKIKAALKRLNAGFNRLLPEGNPSPESFLFGAIVAMAVAVSVFSLRSPGQVSLEFPTVDLSKDRVALEKRINKVVDGYPIEEMSPYIARKSKRTASFLVAIAKKESNWGRHTPKRGGRECYNYWGYRGPENPTASGYSCFKSPQQAVDVVGGRINELVVQKIDTPKEMVIWKCGSVNCARGDSGAAKWIWDVGVYYKKIYSFPKKG